MWKRNARDPIDPMAEELITECEAFLGGRYAELMRAQGRQVPPWAWVNVLAHRTRAELTELARQGNDTSPAAPDGDAGWHRALAFLADELVREAQPTGERALAGLQRSALVPLELDLAGSPEDRVADAGRLAAVVMAAMDRHRSSHSK